MLSRSEDYTSTSAAPPPNHLTASLLSSLFDRLKTLPEGESTSKLYKEYGVSEAKMERLRRWVNSPSVDKDRTQVILTEDGEESVKMMVSRAIGRCIPWKTC
jgi:cell division FtsZ-interacting protein ZapD